LGALLRGLFAWLIYLLAVAFATPAMAARASGDLPLKNACMLLGNPQAEPSKLIAEVRKFDCAADPKKFEVETLWVRFDLTSQAIEGNIGWTYDHALIQARSESVWIAFEDGRVRQSPTAREEARSILGGPTQRYALPRETGKITALLVRLDGLQNRRGPIPRASLTSNDQTFANMAQYYLVFGLMAGIMFGILFYNFTLYVALRYRVLAAYLGSISSTLFYGLVGSNAILWFAPGISTASQFGWHATAIALGFFATSIYFQEFLEPGIVGRWQGRALNLIGGATVLLASTRIFGEFLPWRIFDGFVYLGFALMIGLILALAIKAWRQGSVAVRYYMLAWTAPLIVTLARILWGLGNVAVESPIFDASTFISLCLEALLSSIGLSWRLRQLRTERDQARDLAGTDPLSGLLNRRAFIERAIEGDQVKRLILLDLDHFKAINDRFGHDVGDEVIIGVSHALRATAPEGALVGRIGGEEFAVLVNFDSDVTLAHNLCRAVAAMRLLPGRQAVTISAGVATELVRNEPEWRRIYIAADAALYDAKRSGRNRVRESWQAQAA
jgi:diguanylate cyclase (GGDEF)-like protein